MTKNPTRLPLTALPLEDLENVSGGMNWQSFPRSQNIEDQRGANSPDFSGVLDNPGWGGNNGGGWGSDGGGSWDSSGSGGGDSSFDNGGGGWDGGGGDGDGGW